MTYADFSQARMIQADGRGAAMFRTRMHRADTLDAQFSDRRRALETDEKLATAEQWKAPKV